MHSISERNNAYLKSLIVQGLLVPTILIFLVILLTGGFLNDFFIAFGETIYYPALGLFASLSVFGILFLRTRHLRFRTKLNLLLMALFLVLFNLANTWFWGISSYNPPFKRPFGYPFLNFADGILVAVVIVLFFHLNSMRRFDINVPFSLFFVGMVTPALLITILEGISGRETEYNQLKFVSGYFLPLIGIAGFGVAIYGIRIAYLILLNSSLDDVRKGSYGFTASFVFLSYALASQVLFVGDTIMIFRFRLRILQLILFVIGSSFLILVYAKYPIFAYALPYRIYELIVYSSAGSPIWSVSFISQSEDKREGLKVGALTAIGELIRDLSGFSGKLSEIQLDDGVLLLEQEKRFAACLIAEGVSFQLFRIFQEFSQEIFNLLQNEASLKKGQIPEPANSFYPLIEKYFPVRFEEFKISED
ncbi:MAG: hypothetical protein D6732_28325 [Methanobacteriota archaeon]|nr:MAG: hypothetical protein D6732_28325 [Euryarchaeota archaeon]